VDTNSISLNVLLPGCCLYIMACLHLTYAPCEVNAGHVYTSKEHDYRPRQSNTSCTHTHSVAQMSHRAGKTPGCTESLVANTKWRNTVIFIAIAPSQSAAAHHHGYSSVCWLVDERAHTSRAHHSSGKTRILKSTNAADPVCTDDFHSPPNKRTHDKRKVAHMIQNSSPQLQCSCVEPRNS
jgi:hypothetical protein